MADETKSELPKQVRTISDMMKVLEDEISAAKTGTMPVDVARLVLKGRALQIQTATLQLSYARMHRNKTVGDLKFIANGEEKSDEQK